MKRLVSILLLFLISCGNFNEQGRQDSSSSGKNEKKGYYDISDENDLDKIQYQYSTDWKSTLSIPFDTVNTDSLRIIFSLVKDTLPQKLIDSFKFKRGLAISQRTHYFDTISSILSGDIIKRNGEYLSYKTYTGFDTLFDIKKNGEIYYTTNYIDFIKPIQTYFIEEGYYEGGDYLLIDKQGNKTVVGSVPNFNKNWNMIFDVYSNYDDSESYIRLYSKKQSRYYQIFDISILDEFDKYWIPDNTIWMDDSTVMIGRYFTEDFIIINWKTKANTRYR
jgi:hypothetical protein